MADTTDLPSIVAAMSTYLSSIQHWSCEAEMMEDRTLEEGGPRIQIGFYSRVLVSQPDHLRADFQGDAVDQELYYDGRTLVVFDRRRQTYIAPPARGPLRELLTQLQNQFGLDFPFAELVFRDPADLFFQPGWVGRYVGLHWVERAACHHLLFSGPDMDRQVWIDAGPRPWPRKLVLTYKNEPDAPQYIGLIRTLEELPAIDEKAFVFVPPPGARQLEAQALWAARGGTP